MRKYLYTIFLLFIALLIGGCGSSSGGGDKTEVQEVRFEYQYTPEEGIFHFTHLENCEVVLVIDGREYTVTGNSFDVNKLNLPQGNYGIKIIVYANDGSIYRVDQDRYENYNYDNMGKETYRVSFFDENGNMIKEIFVAYGEVFSESLFPKYQDSNVASYSWKYDEDLAEEMREILEAWENGEEI